jgi:ATP-dependent Clp protease ATP-binding subunit ClpA
MNDFFNLNESVKTAIRIAQSIAREYSNGEYTPAHLLKALLHKESGLQNFIRGMDKDPAYLEEWAEMRIDDFPKASSIAEIIPDNKIPAVFEESDNIRLKLGLLEINPVCVLSALAKPGIAFSPDQLKSFPLREREIFDYYAGGLETGSKTGLHHFPAETDTGNAPRLNVHKYCIDKTAQVPEQKIHPIVSREKELRMMMEILGRHSKPNVMITGEAGVGKTALVDGFASNIINRKVPSYLSGSVIYELDTSALIAGATYRGEVEDRLKNLIRELRKMDKAILFIDEIHVLLDPKQGNPGIRNILKAELSKGELIVIGAASRDEYRKLIESDPTFSRRFEILPLDEPDIPSAIQMVNAVLPRFTEFHHLETAKEAVEEAVRLSRRYIKDRKLPDSAIDLLDRTMSAVKMLNETAGEKITAIRVHEIAAIISAKTGIPIGKIQAQEKERLLNMESLLRRRVVGQDRALKSLVDAILESRSGMNKAGQPIGSFFFLGPTGTGKTELAKSLAEVLFNDEKAMIRFDMSEFKEEHSAALLYGAPPGYVGYEEGGLLVNKIRQQPYAVVLFDEIEKAHSSVYDIFLQIMDEGKLHDRLGKEGDFSNAIVIFTSNVGSEWLAEKMSKGFVPATAQLMEIMGNYFRPEFLARLSEIVPFAPVDETMLLKIFNIQLKSITEALNRQGVEFAIDEDAKRMLAERGFTPKYGARQVGGTIRTYLRSPISRMIVSGKLKSGHKLLAGKDENNELSWKIIAIP